MYGSESCEDPDSARSRMAYIIKFCGVPMVWKSQLISEICLSTAHSEYVALSSAVRAVIPIRETILDALKYFNLPTDSEFPEVYCKLFEDNQTAYLLANEQRLSNNTKYYNLKYHWFWSHVRTSTNPTGWLKVVFCKSDQQQADYLTKGLTRVLLENNRKQVQGW